MLTQTSGPTYYARLQFADASSCVAWLETIPLARVTEAHEMVAAQVGLVTSTALPAVERLRILEVLYQTAEHLQGELARRFIGRALPLSIVEYSVWNSVVDLWQAMFDGYRSCLRGCVKGDGALAAHAPLLALRCIDLTAAAIREYHRVYREVSGALWQQLHQCYAEAERHGLATLGVADPLSASMPARTCAGAYAKALLAHRSNPYTMSPRQMSVMYRWAQLWESLVGIGPTPVAPAMAPVLAVDLSSGQPAVGAQQIEASPWARYVAMEQLGQALRRTLTRLRQGEDPHALGLGDDCRQPGCERLLTLLYIQWCGSGMGQLAGERVHGEDARACVGFATVMRQLGAEAEAFRSGAASIRTAYGPLTEHWNIVSINAPGFIGVARGPECDERIEHHQLVAIKRRSASSFQLAVAQWMKLEEDGELSIGLRLLPGIPNVSALRAPDGTARNEPAVIILPAAPDARAPATLLLAPGIFQPGRILELVSGTLRRVRLLRLAERGVDFERAVFELVA
ncbi:MAG: hypothetical protein IT531_23970 [Burkholderiales bacterium]|nr:hypothetical protein [Burkholderiales bacterium]